jgi:DNA-binding transcriptional ArsR family regulator
MIDINNLELEIGLLHEKVCTALGDTTRIMMLYLLAEKPMCVNEISETLNIPQPTASRHLKVLRERDLVYTERQGTNVEYSLADARIIQALNLMRDLLTERIQAQAVITGAQLMTENQKLKANGFNPLASTSSASGDSGSANPHEKLRAGNTQKSSKIPQSSS